MNNVERVILAAVVTLIACQQNSARAFILPESLPLSKTTAEANLIVCARITNFAPDPTYKPDTTAPALVDMAGMFAAERLKPPGEYTARVLWTIKGQCGATLQLKLPYILSTHYDNVTFPIKPGVTVLLFLKPTADGQWAPVDPTVPLVPVADDVQLTTVGEAGVGAESQVIGLMLATVGDPKLRHASLYLLRSSVDPRIPAALAAYVDDPDLRTRDVVLYCLLSNQQFNVIPRVVALERKLMPDEETIGSSAMSLMALRNLTSPEAVSLLNPLLFEPSHYARINAMSALYKLADRTSIPYLIVALQDPENGYGAYGMLYRLIPALGVPQDPAFFDANREAALRPIYAWWKDELAGSHIAGRHMPGPRPVSAE